MITYRWLTPEEVKTLAPIFEANDGELPDPAFSVVCGAVNDEGKIVGFHVLQLIPHLEPLWIDPEWRAKVSWREFQSKLEGLIVGTEYFIFPGNDRIAKLCKRGGMSEVPMKAFSKTAGEN